MSKEENQSTTSKLSSNSSAVADTTGLSNKSARSVSFYDHHPHPKELHQQHHQNDGSVSDVVAGLSIAEDDSDLFSKYKIHEMVENGNYEMSKLLIDSDANLIDAVDDDVYGRTPLIICSYKKSDEHYRIAKFLLENGCDANIQANYKWNNWTALMTACYYDNARLVELLIASNVDVNLEDIESNTAWQLALENSHKSCIDILLKEMDVNGIESRKKVEKELQEAVFNGDFESTRKHLSMLDGEKHLRQLINATPIGTHSLLYRACRNCNVDIVKLLLEKGAIAREHFYTKYSPLYIACHIGQLEIAQTLLNNFVNLINVKTIEKFLPYHAVCSQGRLDILRFLIQFATCIDTINLREAIRDLDENKSNTISANSPARMIRLFKDAKNNSYYFSLFNLNALDFNNQTGFHTSVVANQTEISEFLLNIKVRKATKADLLLYKEMRSKFERKIQQMSERQLSSSVVDQLGSELANLSTTKATTAPDQQQQSPKMNHAPSFFDQIKNVFMDIKPPFDSYTINYTSSFFMDSADEPAAPKISINDAKQPSLSKAAAAAASTAAESSTSIEPAAQEATSASAAATEQPSVYFNPINLNQYSKFGTICLHEAIKNRNHKLVKLLLLNGADPNLPIYDVKHTNEDSTTMHEKSSLSSSDQTAGAFSGVAGGNVISNCLCEALKLKDEQMLKILIDNTTVSEENQRLALKNCLGQLGNLNSELNEAENQENFIFFKRKMPGVLLKLKTVGDSEHKINSSYLKFKLIYSYAAEKQTNAANSKQFIYFSLASESFSLDNSLFFTINDKSEWSSNLTLNKLLNDAGLIINWTNLESKLEFICESWLLVCAKHFKFVKNALNISSSSSSSSQSKTSADDHQQAEADAEAKKSSERNNLKKICLHDLNCVYRNEPIDASSAFSIYSINYVAHQMNKLHLHVITRIDLSNNLLEELPFSLFQIESLKFMKLSNNNLKSLPITRNLLFDDVEMFINPTANSNAGLAWTCNALEELDIDHNQLSGELTPRLFQIKSLRHLNVSHNKLEKLPFDLWLSPSLLDLNVSFNNIKSLPILPPINKEAFSSNSGVGSNRIGRHNQKNRQPPPVIQSQAAKQPPSIDIPTTKDLFRPIVAVNKDDDSNSNSNKVDNQFYREKSIVKANFWQGQVNESSNAYSNPMLLKSMSYYKTQQSQQQQQQQHAAADKDNRGGRMGHSLSFSHGMNPADQNNFCGAMHGSKLVELNLSHNKFAKMPDCLSCFAPKLVRLNLSFNQLKYMGAVCDLPASLKFLDLSNNQIKLPARLLNESLLKFIMIYFDKYAAASASIAGSSNNSAKLSLASNLLLDNEFCYLNMANKYRLIRNNTNNQATTPTDHQHQMMPQSRTLFNKIGASSSSYQLPPSSSAAASHIRSKTREPMRALMENPKRDDENAGTGGSSRFRSNSRRRTRSQSRNPNKNKMGAINDSSTCLLPNQLNQNKKALPFDLFLINLRYNQSYGLASNDQSSSSSSSSQLNIADLYSLHNKLINDFLDYYFGDDLHSKTFTTMNTDDLMLSYFSSQLRHTDLDDMHEQYLWLKEKQLLNSNNLGMFIDQLCPHKRHFKLENLKILYLNSNKLKTCSILMDLDKHHALVNSNNDLSLAIQTRFSQTEDNRRENNIEADDNVIDYEIFSDSDSDDENLTPNLDSSSSAIKNKTKPKIFDESNESLAKTNNKPPRIRLRDKLLNNSPRSVAADLLDTSGKETTPRKNPLNTSYNRKHLKFWTRSEERSKLAAKLIYPSLTHLDISSNMISKLTSSLSLLDNLMNLNASSNARLFKVSPSLGLMEKLWNLDLKNCLAIQDPPMLESLVKQNTKTADILGYLKSILEHSRPYNRIKLMFVGIQAIGKTSLLNRLRDEGTQTSNMSTWTDRTATNQQSGGGSQQSSNISTVGIDINEWIYEKSKSSKPSILSSSGGGADSQHLHYQYPIDNFVPTKSFGPITFRTWDFGGQREYYATHQYFISKRALYLVCWKLTEQEKGINEIHTWLSNIQTRAPGSPVIIVGTHQDQIAKLKNYKEISMNLQRLIYERFVLRGASGTCESNESAAAYPPIMKSIEVSSKTGHNIKYLAKLIYDVATQMRVPGTKDQLLLEQKIPVTYLALEESITRVLTKLKLQSRIPVLYRNDYLREVKVSVEELFPDLDSSTADEHQMAKLLQSPRNSSISSAHNLFIRFRDDAEIMQATQFLHENGVVIHYNDVALRDLFFLDPQWLCDMLATVVAIREVNPFAAKGIMKISDLLVLFKGRGVAVSASSKGSQPATPSITMSVRFAADFDEIKGFIIDLLSKFELALTWDNEYLLIPSLLPTEAMLKFANQDLRIGIVSKQKAYNERLNEISLNNLMSTNTNNPENQSLEHRSTIPTFNLNQQITPMTSSNSSNLLSPYGNQQMVTSKTTPNFNKDAAASTSTPASAATKSNDLYSKITMPTDKIKLNSMYECLPYLNRASDTHMDSSSIVRLYCLTYLPSGFFSRVITRILSDNILKECLLELIELDYCLFNKNANQNPETSESTDVSSIDLNASSCSENQEELVNSLIDFVCQEAEWRCWQTGIELKYLDYTFLRIKEIVNDPLLDLEVRRQSVDKLSSNTSVSSASSFSMASAAAASNSSCAFSTRPVLYRDVEGELKLKSSYPLSLSATQKQAPFSFLECYASFNDYKIVKAKQSSKTTIRTDYAGGSNKFNFPKPQTDSSASQKSSSAAATDDNEEDDILIKILCNRRISIKIFAQIVEIIDSLLEDWYPDLGTRFMQDSKGDYLVTRLAPCNQCIRSAANSTSSRRRLESNVSAISIPENETANEQQKVGSYDSKSFMSNLSRSPALKSSFDSSAAEVNYDEQQQQIPGERMMKPLESFDWIFCFMLDDICFAVLNEKNPELQTHREADSLLKCPKHGRQQANMIAPDLAFEDIDENLLISNERSLTIEALLGRGSFGSVFSGYLNFKENSIKVAIKVLENMNNMSSESIRCKISNLNKENNKNGGGNKNMAINSHNSGNSGNSGSSNKFWNYRKEISMAAKAYTQARQEISILNTLKHENIVAMLGLSVRPLAIILELAPMGNLKELIERYKSNMCKLSPQIVQNVCMQISSALIYLHANRIIYRDLKADNVLVWRFPMPFHQLLPNSSAAMKPSDFTLSSSSDHDHLQQADSSSVLLKLADYSISRSVLPTGTKGFAGTEGFMAPEIIRFNGEETYSEKVDCFSFGMVIYELISLRHPFDGHEQIKELILNGGRPMITDQECSYPTLMLDLMCLCWQDNPNDRPPAFDINKYCKSYEFSNLVDVTVLEDYEQNPLIVTCLNQEDDFDYEEENENEEELVNAEQQQSYDEYLENDYYEEVEEEEEDAIDIWIARNSVDEGTSQFEILTYENKQNCTNRKLINVCNEPIEAMCVLKGSQVWCIDSAKCIFIYCCKTYKKLNQYLLDVKIDTKIEWMYSLDNMDKLLMCTTNGTILILSINNIALSKSSSSGSGGGEEELEYVLFNLAIPVHSSVIIPTKYEKSYDLWLGSNNGELFAYSLKTMSPIACCTHTNSHHYQLNAKHNQPSKNTHDPFTSKQQQHQNKESAVENAVTILKTTPNDSFFLWSYVYPGSTIYLWNHMSKKIMSAYDCRKAANDLNLSTSSTSTTTNADFRIVEMSFLNNQLYCGVNNGFVLVLKRLTLTPLRAFSAHRHQLHHLCPLTFETRLIKNYYRHKDNKQSFNVMMKSASKSNGSNNSTVIVKRTSHMLLSIGRALAPNHEDIYLSNSQYRIDALSKYATCLILCSWYSSSSST